MVLADKGFICERGFWMEEVLTILKKKEAEMEGNMLKKIQAFKYLYKEQFKEFGKLMKD